MPEFTQKEQNMIDTAKSVLAERGYNVVEVVRDSYGCPNIKIENPHGPQYPAATGAIVYPSGRTSADIFEFLFS